MAEKKKIQPEKIIIREFRLVKGLIDSPFDFRISNIRSFDFNVDFNTGFNIEENLIKADFNIEVSTISVDAVQEAKCTYHFVFLYYVEDLREHAQLTEDGVIDWNPFLANAIASITYSTSRGILLSRFQGTVMKDFILPVNDPNALLVNKVSQQIATRQS
jgi:hypothetical protein